MNRHDFRSSGSRAFRSTARLGLIAAVLVGAASASAQVVLSGTVAVSGGATLLDGDRPAFQETFLQKKDGYGGLEDFTASRTTDASLFRFEARFVPGNDDYRLSARYEKFDAYYLEANYQSFRTYYDGSGGRFLPLNRAISYFDEDLALDRSFFSFEIGTLLPNSIQWRIRYDRLTRDGTKNSLRWGDTGLLGRNGVRNLIPAYLVVDEERDIITAEAGQRTDEANWKITGRHERTKFNNRNVSRRNAFEPQDRYDISRQGSSANAVSGNGYYERVFTENLRVSAGGLVTSIDTNLSGNRVYGPAPDSEFSATSVRRQAQDNGYYGLVGNAQLKQYLANLNVVYQPTKFITVLPGLKYEHLRQDGAETHLDTDVVPGRGPGGGGGGGGPGGGGGLVLNSVETAMQTDSRNGWNEVTEDLEVRYARWSDWQLSVRGQWNQGTGDLIEQSILVANRVPEIDRDTDYKRTGQRYTANATWYARPGLTFGAQYNYRLKLADYTARRDNTSNAPNSQNRYPQFIIDNDLETKDASFRMSWRPKSNLTFATRYAYQRSTVTTTFDRLPEIENGRLTRHVVTQTATWNATPRLLVTGAVNVTYDQLAIPQHRLTFNSDNNYVSANLGAGYALGKVTDVYLDLSHYRADNYTDNPTVTLPFNMGQTLQSGFITWVRRQSDRLVYTAKYGYATNRDGTYGGQNDFNAHLFYGKVQYKF